MQRFGSLWDCVRACITVGTICVALPTYADASAANDRIGKNITIKSYAFVPASKTVALGTTVVWINEDDDPHTVTGTSAATAPNSPALDTHEQYSFTFTKPDVYKYFCKLHPHMQGEIIVQ